MLTIKQLQTFYWIARLGTVSKAADKLHVTQSAATKRLQELEAVAATPLFESGPRKEFLTPKGKELVTDCERLLAMLSELERLKNTTVQPVRTLHVGLGELAVLTWFPAFLQRMKALFPTITVQPEIDLSSILRRKVEEGHLDFAFIPEPAEAEGLVRVRLGEAQFGWFAPPGEFVPGTIYPLHELATKPIIEQSVHSIITTLCSRLWEGAGANPQKIYGGNNVFALGSLISAGVGISCLPVALFKREVELGKLQLVETTPAAPTVTYYCCFLKYPNSAIGYEVADIARRCYVLNATPNDAS